MLASRGNAVVPAVEAVVRAAGLSDEQPAVTVTTGPDRPELGQEVVVRVDYDLTGMTFFSWNGLIGDARCFEACAKME